MKSHKDIIKKWFTVDGSGEKMHYIEITPEQMTYLLHERDLEYEQELARLKEDFNTLSQKSRSQAAEMVRLAQACDEEKRAIFEELEGMIHRDDMLTLKKKHLGDNFGQQKNDDGLFLKKGPDENKEARP